MPQLDKISYISQALWILIISINSYILLIFILFLNFINIKKIQINNFLAVSSLFSNITFLHNVIDSYKKKIL